MHPSDAAPLLRAPLARRWLGLPESAGPEAITRFVETSEDIRFQACGPAGCRSWLLIERAQCEQPEAWLHTEEARAARRAPHLRALREALLESQPEWVLHDRAPATAALLAGLTPWGPAPLVGADGPQLWRPTR